MIHCGRLTTSQVIKILGIFQLVGAIVITAVGIGVVVTYIDIDHVKQSNTEIPDSYVDMHWTVTYGAAIWMGLIIAIAGGFGCFADVKPHKSKYVYGTMAANVVVMVAGILLVIFCHDAITWFDTCQYTYHTTTTLTKLQRDCSANDKSKGQHMYWTIFVVTFLVLPLTIGMFVMIVYVNKVLFEDGIGGSCFRSIVYKAKGNGKTSVSFKTKNTHEFNKEMVISKQSQPQYTVNDSAYC